MATKKTKKRAKKQKSWLELCGFSTQHGGWDSEAVPRSDSPGQTVKNAGGGSLAELGRMGNTHTQTLDRWHKDRPEAFDLMLIGAVVVKRLLEEGFVFRSRYEIEQALESVRQAAAQIKELTAHDNAKTANRSRRY